MNVLIIKKPNDIISMDMKLINFIVHSRWKIEIHWQDSFSNYIFKLLLMRLI